MLAAITTGYAVFDVLLLVLLILAIVYLVRRV